MVLASLRRLSFAALCISSLLVDTTHAQDKPAVAKATEIKPLKALLVTGGCCHDYDIQKELISKGLWQRAHIDVTVVRQGASAKGRGSK